MEFNEIRARGRATKTSPLSSRAEENLAAERERNRSTSSTMALVNEPRNDFAIVKKR